MSRCGGPNQYHYGSFLITDEEFDPFKFKMVWDLTHPFGFAYKKQFKLLVGILMAKSRSLGIQWHWMGKSRMFINTSEDNIINNFCSLVENTDMFDKWIAAYRLFNYEDYILFVNMCLKEMGSFWKTCEEFGVGKKNFYGDRVFNEWDVRMMTALVKKSRKLNKIKDGEKPPSKTEKWMNEVVRPIPESSLWPV